MYNTYTAFSTRKVRRNGLIFQIPDSPFCPFRYAVHSDGTGASWTETAPDVDQPLGLAFRELQDIRKGVRKRLEHEHSDLADATVGGIHTPGGCAVLGIEDGTATILADGTLKGHGLVWDNTARLWCSTAVAGASTTGDFTLVSLHPDKQWGGGDITWTGAHEFDASVDISGNVAIDGDFTVDGTCHFDATGIEFGGGMGIGLFYDPTSYSGGQTTTLGNGMIIKADITTSTQDAEETFTFDTAFPNGCIAVIANRTDAGASAILPVTAIAAATFKINRIDTIGGSVDFYYIAIGY